MPPKKQITKEQMIDCAFQLVKEHGYETLTARSLAKELNCSTQPIYQTFSDMHDLKAALIQKSYGQMMKYIEENSSMELPPALSKILGYVQFAKEEKKLFQLMFSPDAKNSKATQTDAQIDAQVEAQAEPQTQFQVQDETELNMLVYAHGIVMMQAFGTLALSWEEVRKMIIHAYECFKKD